MPHFSALWKSYSSDGPLPVRANPPREYSPLLTRPSPLPPICGTSQLVSDFWNDPSLSDVPQKLPVSVGPPLKIWPFISPHQRRLHARLVFSLEAFVCHLKVSSWARIGVKDWLGVNPVLGNARRSPTYFLLQVRTYRCRLFPGDVLDEDWVGSLPFFPTNFSPLRWNYSDQAMRFLLTIFGPAPSEFFNSHPFPLVLYRGIARLYFLAGVSPQRLFFMFRSQSMIQKETCPRLSMILDE